MATSSQHAELRPRTVSAGELLRQWRQHRRKSQLELATEAQISTRHLSCVETGRARPSRGLLLALGEVLGLSLRERNQLLLAGGHAPHFAEHALAAAPLQLVRDTVQQLLEAMDPSPAVAIDRHWTLLQGNHMAQRLLGGCDPTLLTPPINVMRLSLHPRGLAPMILNLGEWRALLLARLRRQAADSGDPILADLHAELAQWPPLPGEDEIHSGYATPLPDVLVLLRLRSRVGELALLSTTTVFGTPQEVTVAELALEIFHPADDQTRMRLAQLAAG